MTPPNAETPAERPRRRLAQVHGLLVPLQVVLSAVGAVVLSR